MSKKNETMMRTSFSLGVTTMQINWLWLAIGLIPYSIKRYQAKDEQILMIKAIFWRLTIRGKKEQYSWEISFPWIEHWRP
jgi:hypothetical protein